jgi:hypothetical protein
MPRYDNYRDDRSRRESRATGTGAGKRVFWLFLGLGVAFFVLFRVADKPSASAPRPVRKLAELKPISMQEQVTEQGILGGAKVIHESRQAARLVNVVVPAANGGGLLPAEPRLEKTERGYRVLGARSENPYVWPRDEAEAKADALRVAKARLAIELNGMTPELEEIAVRREVPSEEVKKLWEDQRLETDRVWVVVDVQTSEDSIRKERAKARFGQIGFWVGAAFLVLLTGYGFLRLDQWTKGYLTTALFVIAVLVVGGAIVTLGVVAH